MTNGLACSTMDVFCLPSCKPCVLKYQKEDVQVEKLSCLYKPKLSPSSYLNRFKCALQTTTVVGLILMSLGNRVGLNMHGLHVA